MIERAPNIQALIVVTTYTFAILVGVWIYTDARARRAQKPLFAALAMLLLGPLWLAFYLTDRPRRPDERRAGGFAWNWTRNFAIAWSAASATWLGVAAFALLKADAETTLTTMRMLRFAGSWLVPIAAILTIGYFLRRSETEPRAAAPARSPIPLAAVTALAALLTFTILATLFARAA